MPALCSIHFHFIFFYFSSFLPLYWASMGQFSRSEFFNPTLCYFSSKVMRFCIQKSLNRNCASAPIFFGRYVILLLEWWKEYKAILSCIRVGQDDFCKFLVVMGELFLELKPGIFWPARYTLLGWWRNIKPFQAVDVSVGIRFYVKQPRFLVKQPRFYVKQTLFLCETTLFPCGRLCILVDRPVSLGTAPFSFSIRQNRFYVDGSVPVYTREKI